MGAVVHEPEFIAMFVVAHESQSLDQWVHWLMQWPWKTELGEKIIKNYDRDIL